MALEIDSFVWILVLADKARHFGVSTQKTLPVWVGVQPVTVESDVASTSISARAEIYRDKILAS